MLSTAAVAVRLALLASSCCCCCLLTATASAVGNESADVAGTEVCSRTRVRLAGGYGRSDGMVLVQDVAENWHRLCFMVSSAAANVTRLLRNVEVMCRNAGQRPGKIKASIILRDQVPDKWKTDYSRYVTLWQLDCKGSESTLSDCRPLGFQFKNPTLVSASNERCWYSVACSDDHNFSVAIRESETLEQVLPSDVTVRSTALGTLHATSFGMSGKVCASSADVVNIAWIAKVGCRQGGYRNGIGIQLIDKANSSECLMPNTVCSGIESTLTDCLHEGVWGDIARERSRIIVRGEQSSGVPVQVMCGSIAETVNITLVSNVTLDWAAQLVFVKFGDLLLPVINRASPDTCRAICRHATGDRNATARCHIHSGSAIKGLHQVGDYVYYAQLSCGPEHAELAECAYGITVMPMSESSTTSDGQLVARCDVPSWRRKAASSPDEPKAQLVDRGGSRISSPLGCARVLVDGSWRYVASYDGASDLVAIARVVCRHLQTPLEENSVTSVLYSSHAEDCPSAQVLASCGPQDYLPPDDCSYVMASPDVARPSLFVACAMNSSFDLKMEKGFGNGDGAIKVTQGGLNGYIDVKEWTDAAASVACRELGMNANQARAIVKYFPRNRERTMTLRVSGCAGTEASLQQCAGVRWTALAAQEDDEKATYVGGVVCGGGRIRLNTATVPPAATAAHWIPAVLGSDGGGGGDEPIYFCLTDFSLHFLSGHDYGLLALCRQAGVNRVHKASEYKWRTNNGTMYTRSKAFMNVACGGPDVSLEECTYEALVNADSCRNQYATWSPVAAVKCETQPVGTRVRLVGGSSRYEGHVEVLYNGEWGAICDDGFNDYAATLVCREIFGQQSSGYAVQGSRFATRNEKFTIDGLYCLRGEHQRFLDCSRNDWGDHDCTACEQAGVVCTQVQYLSQPVATIELVGGAHRASCYAEAYPPAQYQWITNGTQRVIADSVVTITCNGYTSGQSYICIAFNEADEKSVEIHVAPLVGCDSASNDPSHGAKPTGLIAAVSLLACLCVVTALYALYLHRLVRAASSGKGFPVGSKFIAYDNPTFH